MKQLIFLIPAIVISLLFSQMLTAQSVRGNGNVVKQTRKITGLDGIKVGGAFEVIVEEGSDERVTVETDENLLEIVETTVDGDILTIAPNRNIEKPTKLTVYVTLKKLSSVSVSGAADLTGKSTFKSRDMYIKVSGGADVELDIEVNSLEAKISGSSDVELEGSADEIELEISGSSDLEADKLIAKHGRISISGSADAAVHVTSSIRVSASGSSDVECSGNPSKKDVNTTGSADVHFN